MSLGFESRRRTILALPGVRVEVFTYKGGCVSFSAAWCFLKLVLETIRWISNTYTPPVLSWLCLSQRTSQAHSQLGIVGRDFHTTNTLWGRKVDSTFSSISKVNTTHQQQHQTLVGPIVLKNKTREVTVITPCSSVEHWALSGLHQPPAQARPQPAPPKPLFTVQNPV